MERRCTECTQRLPDDYESDLCPACIVLQQALLQWERDRCEASGEDWRCTGQAKMKKLGRRVCPAHYQQQIRGRPLAPIRRRAATEEMFHGWAQVMRENGWTVTLVPPIDQEEDKDGATQ